MNAKKHFPQVFPPNFKAGIAPGLKFAFKQQPKFMPVLRLVHCNSSLRLLLSVGIIKFGQESGSAFAKPFSLITIWFSLFRFRVYSHWQESFSLHFRDRRGADSHRFRNGAEITALMCEQKPYPVGFSYRRKSYPVQCKPLSDIVMEKLDE